MNIDMDKLPEKSNWKSTYTLAAGLGIAYIILLGIFTWIFNYPL